jgi:hypothetical protein
LNDADISSFGGALGSLAMYWIMNWLGAYAACINVMTNRYPPGSEFIFPPTGEPANVSWVEGCDHCRCAAVRVGFGPGGSGSDDPEFDTKEWARKNMGIYYWMWLLDHWIKSGGISGGGKGGGGNTPPVMGGGNLPI